MDLRRFFDRAIRASFHDLALPGDPAAPYLGDLLTRFVRIENLFPRGTSVPRLETVVDMMLEAQGAWDVDSPDFRPEHEVSVRRHIGDYTLFMTGIFPERVERTSATSFYISQGKPSTHARGHATQPLPTGDSPSASRATPASSTTPAASTSLTRPPTPSSGCSSTDRRVSRLGNRVAGLD